MHSKKLLILPIFLLLILTGCSFALSSESVPGNDVEFVSYTVSEVKKQSLSTYRVYFSLTFKNKSNSYVYKKNLTLKSGDSSVSIYKSLNGYSSFKSGATFTIGDGTDLYFDVPATYDSLDSIPIYWTFKSGNWASIGTINIKTSDIFPTALNKMAEITNQDDNLYFTLQGCKIIAENTTINDDKHIYIDVCFKNGKGFSSSGSLTLTTEGTGYDTENVYKNAWGRVVAGKYWNLGSSVNDNVTYLTNPLSGFEIKINSDNKNKPITVKWSISDVGGSGKYDGYFVFTP